MEWFAAISALLKSSPENLASFGYVEIPAEVVITKTASSHLKDSKILRLNMLA